MKTRVASAAAALALVAGPALGADCPAGRRAPDRALPSLWTLQVENDLFGSGLDRHYTNGMQVSRVLGSDAMPRGVECLANRLPGIDDRDSKAMVVSIGQHMYTPDDKARTVPDPADRPYAGWTYVSLGAMAENSETRVLHDATLDLGVIGPAAGAGEIQNRWHNLIGAPHVYGWGHQLKNEPGLLLTYQARQRLQPVWHPFGLDTDMTYGAGGALGNVFTHAGVSAAFRVGDGLDATYSAPFIRPSPPSAAVVRDARSRDVRWNLFAGVEGRAVARNIFLDGNTWQDSPSVDKRPLVLDVQFGVEVMWDTVRVAFTQIMRSREFDGQDEPTRFGSLSVSFGF